MRVVEPLVVVHPLAVLRRKEILVAVAVDLHRTGSGRAVLVVVAVDFEHHRRRPALVVLVPVAGSLGLIAEHADLPAETPIDSFDRRIRAHAPRIVGARLTIVVVSIVPSHPLPVRWREEVLVAV